jgi:hypothetical protein
MNGHDAQLIFYSFMTAFVGWPTVWALYRLFHPWRCKCGKLHWSAAAMLEHVEMKHSHEVSK